MFNIQLEHQEGTEYSEVDKYIDILKNIEDKPEVIADLSSENYLVDQNMIISMQNAFRVSEIDGYAV